MKATILVALMIFQSCGILQPRQAQPPDNSQGTPWVVPNNPKDVFINLNSGFGSTKDSNYDRSLDPTFTFVPTDQDAAQFGPSVFQNWTKDVELQVLTRIKGDFPTARAIQFGSGPDMVFTKEDIEVGKAYFEGQYMITLNSGTATADTFAGVARFTIIQSTQGWVLTAWQDLDVSGTGRFSTSGRLRGQSRSAGG